MEYLNGETAAILFANYIVDDDEAALLGLSYKKESSKCLETSNLLNSITTTIVGFASTTDTSTSDQIKSLQALYYTQDPTVCDCLASKPNV